MRSRLFHQSQAKDCQEIEELRRICCQETDRARKARIDELSMHQERNLTTVSQLMRKFCLLCDTINDNGVSTQRHHDEDNRDGIWVSVARLCSWEVKQLRDNWKQACTWIELCSDKHITLFSQIWINWPVSYKLMSETLRFPQSKRSSYCCTWSRDFSSLRSLPQSEERECQHAAYANIRVHTATHALAVYATVLQFCQSLPTSSCRYNSSDLWVAHKFARAIDSRYVETEGFRVCLRRWLNSRIPLVCSSPHVACVWTVWFSLSAPLARAVVTTSVSEWSDTLWGHGQPNS